jgi:hypothetical protein
VNRPSNSFRRRLALGCGIAPSGVLDELPPDLRRNIVVVVPAITTSSSAGTHQRARPRRARTAHSDQAGSGEGPPMKLTRRQRRELAALGQQLAQDDPGLAEQLSRPGLRRARTHAGVVIGRVMFVLGLLMVLGGTCSRPRRRSHWARSCCWPAGRRGSTARTRHDDDRHPQPATRRSPSAADLGRAHGQT